MNENTAGSVGMGLMPTAFKHPFDYQKPTDEQVIKITEVREACKALYEVLNTLPHSRGKSMAMTKLEETSMWANKGIVFN